MEKGGKVIGEDRTYELAADDYGKKIQLEAAVTGIDVPFVKAAIFKDINNVAVKLVGNAEVNSKLTAKVVDKKDNDVSEELETHYFCFLMSRLVIQKNKNFLINF